MAEIFDFYINDNRSITFKLSEPIMLEDNGVSDWRFHIPNTVNGLDTTGWAWWLVYVNAKNEKYTIPLTLEYDYDRPDAYSIATYTVDYGMSCKVGNVRFSLEAIDADTGGTILHEWHTKTYSTNVVDTLQGNQIEYDETESDLISALLIEVRNRTNQLIGGATPEPKNLIADMIDPDKVYLYVGSESDESTGYWYYHNGTRFIPGGVYGAGVVDPIPTQGSTNAVSSGGVWDAIEEKGGLSENAKTALLACFEHVAWVDEHGQDYYDALYDALYPTTSLVSISAVFTQGGAVIYPTTPLNDLKAYLVVTGHYNDGTSKTITDYALSGTLEVGTNTVTVSKEGKTTTFNVTVSQPYWDYEWNASSMALPEGMTADYYDFTTESGAMFAKTPVLDFDYIGNCKLQIEMKAYSKDKDGEYVFSVNNNPQILIKNAVVDTNQFRGIKVIMDSALGTSSEHGMVAVSVNGVNSLIPESNSSVYHLYELTAENNSYTVTIDDTPVTITQNTNTSPYYGRTGMSTSAASNPPGFLGAFIKSIKFKRL